MRIGGVLATVATAIILGAALLQSGSGTAANLWVDLDAGTCTRSATLISYPNNGTECSSLNAAYAIASAGDVVGVRPGTYAAQTIAYRAALDGLTPGCNPYGEWAESVSTANCVKFVPDGGTVIITGTGAEGLVINASNVWIAGTATGSMGLPASRTYNIVVDSSNNADFGAITSHGSLNFRTASSTDIPDYVTVEGVKVHTLEMVGGTHYLARDVEVGPSWRSETAAGPCVAPQDKIQNSGAFSVALNFATLDRAYIHGQSSINSAGCHSAGMIWQTGLDDVTVRNTIFQANMVYQVQTGTGAMRRITFENVVFGCIIIPGTETTCEAGGYGSSLNLSSAVYTDWLVRYTAHYANPVLDAGGSFVTSNFVGSLSFTSNGDPFCADAGLTKAYNVWASTPGTCGDATDGASTLLVNLFVDPGNATNPNYHLLNTTNSANNLVSPTGSPYNLGFDFEGQTRPVAANRDAGVDEQ